MRLLYPAAVCLLCGLPLALDMSRYGMLVDAVTVFFLPVSAVLCAFMFFWVYGVDKARQELNVGARWSIGPWWNSVAKYVFVGVGVDFLVVILQFAIGIG